MSKPTHPRVGGEDENANELSGVEADSPPRGRGRRERKRAERCRSRLTPAWAGKTTACTGVPVSSTTHPRVGGEDAKAAYAELNGVDSPPRGRGRP